MSAGQFLFFKLLAEVLSPIAAFAISYALAMRKYHPSKQNALADILQFRINLKAEFLIVFGILLVVLAISGYRQNIALFTTGITLLVMVFILAVLFQAWLIASKASRRRSFDKIRESREEDTQLDPSAPVRWLTIGQNIFAVQPNVVITRRRYGTMDFAAEFGTVIGVLIIWIVERLALGHNLPLFGMVMATAIYAGSFAAKFINNSRPRRLLSVRGRRIIVTDISFGDVEDAEIAIARYSAGYEVRLEVPGGTYPRTMFLLATRKIEQAEQIKAVLNEWLESYKASPAWPPAPDMPVPA